MLAACDKRTEAESATKDAAQTVAVSLTSAGCQPADFTIQAGSGEYTLSCPNGKSAANGKLNEYIKHTGSGIYAIPPGVQPDGYWGQTLFEG
jgi:hypothetical protein